MVRVHSDMEEEDERGLRILVKGRGRLGSVERFAWRLYPDSPLRQRCFLDILGVVRDRGEQGLILSNLYKRLQRNEKNPDGYSAQTISDLWVAMLQGGLLEREGRGRPAYLSNRFVSKVRELADFWEGYSRDLLALTPITRPGPRGREKLE